MSNTNDKTKAPSIRSRIAALGLQNEESASNNSNGNSNSNSNTTTQTPQVTASNTQKKAPKLPPPRKQSPETRTTTVSSTPSKTPPKSFENTTRSNEVAPPPSLKTNSFYQKDRVASLENATQKRPFSKPEPPPKSATSKPNIPPRPQPRNPSLSRVPNQQQQQQHVTMQFAKPTDASTDERLRPMSASLTRMQVAEAEPDSVKGAGEFVTYEDNGEVKEDEKVTVNAEPSINNVDSVLDEQFKNKYRNPSPQQTNAAIVLQKYTRRFLAKKKLKSMKSRRLHREKCAAEILSTEKYYVECLKALSEVYLEPLKKMALGPKPPITREQISQIFSDIEVIINVNAAFLEGLEKKLKDYSTQTIISDVFLDMAPFFKTYTRYCNNYDRSQNVLKDIKNNPELKQIIAGMDKDPRTTKLGLASYLILPIQRIPRYRLLLTELIKQTEKEHPDYEQLNKALERICAVADHLNTAMKGIDATNEIIKIQNQFNTEVSFIEPHRRFLSGGRLSELKETDKVSFSGRDVYLHLFNDIVVVSTPSGSEFTYKAEMQLNNAILLDYLRNDKTNDTIFDIKAPNYQIILRAPSVEEKRKWLTSLSKAINESKQLRKDNNLNVTVNAVADETASTLFVAKTGDLDDFELTPEECVAFMKNGATMLKYGRTGKPHFRTIVLSRNERMLLWSSPNKTTHESKVALTDVSKMEKGQKTAIFAKYRNPDHEPLSFSLLYKNRTLDLVCKDKKEYMIWITGIQFLLSNIIQGKAPSSSADVETSAVILSHDLNKEKQKFKEMFERIGDAYTWGQGSRGALGHGDQQDQTVPLVMKDFLYLDVASVACENSASAALMLTGELFTWGSGEKGRLGHGDTADRVKPALVKGLHGRKIMKVTMGALHTLAVDENGHVFAFGSSEFGQLGLGSDFTGIQNTPVMIPALKSVKVKNIACGHHHSACISLDGVVMIWGRGEDGQLGLGHKNNVFVPTVIPTLQGVKAFSVALGLWHSMVHTEEGRLYSFGNATYGQLGLGNTDESLEPKKIPFFENKNVISVSAGSAHSACVIDNGEVFCWGSGIYGQIGNNEKQHAYIPTLVRSLRGDAGKEIVCGVNHVLALMESGKVYAWGAGTYGRLGLKSESDQHVPKEIQFLADKSVRTLAAGGSQSACVCAHQWVPDKDAVACMNCKEKFTFLKRRHHCRYCGGIFCGNCTTKRKAILRFGFDDPVRVCDYCFTILSTSSV